MAGLGLFFFIKKLTEFQNSIVSHFLSNTGI